MYLVHHVHVLSLDRSIDTFESVLSGYAQQKISPFVGHKVLQSSSCVQSDCTSQINLQILHMSFSPAVRLRKEERPVRGLSQLSEP